MSFRAIARLTFAIGFLALMYFGTKDTTLFSTYSDFITVAVTLVYVYLNYELIQITHENRDVAYIGAEYILTNNLDSLLLSRYQDSIKKSKNFLALREEFSAGNARTRDMVFIKVENLGNTTALNVIFNVVFKKRSLGDLKTGITKKIHFGDLKKESVGVDIVEIFESPSKNDAFEVTSCYVEFNDANGKIYRRKPLHLDLMSSSALKRDDNVSIEFNSPFSA